MLAFLGPEFLDRLLQLLFGLRERFTARLLGLLGGGLLAGFQRFLSRLGLFLSLAERLAGFRRGITGLLGRLAKSS